MILPKAYMKETEKVRAVLIADIARALQRIDRYALPYVYENAQSDESRMQLIERIINEMYSKSSSTAITQVLSKIENSLSD